jgi:hypothetical protein
MINLPILLTQFQPVQRMKYASKEKVYPKFQKVSIDLNTHSLHQIVPYYECV